MLFIYWNNVVLSLCSGTDLHALDFGTDLHTLELIFLIEWIVDATHMSVITFVQFCFCYLDLKLYDFLSLVFLDSKLDQGSYRGSVNSKIS